MKISNTRTILRKEFARFFGDKSMVFTSVIMPGLLIYIIYSLMGNATETMMKDDSVSRVYAENMPESVEMMFQDTNTIRLITMNVDSGRVMDMISDKDNNVLYVNFPEDFDSLVANRTKGEGEVPNIKIIYNSSNTGALMAFETIKIMLNSYEESTCNLFDINRFEEEGPDGEGLNENIYDMATTNDSLGSLLSMLVPMLIIMLIFSGCMAIAPTSIAGEKERGTIATLLVTPMRRSELAIGKILSLSCFALLSGLSSFLGIMLSLPKMIHADEDAAFLSDIDASIYGVSDYAMLLVVILSCTLVMITAISIISAFAKDVKQAGTLVLPVMMLVMLAGISPMLGSGNEVWRSFIPVYNSAQCMASIMSFKASMSSVILTFGSNVVYSVLGVVGLTALFNSEKVMFGK